VGAWLAARSGTTELAELAHEHGVSGRALLRLTEGTLRRMGVTPRSRRRELLRELLRLRLQQELGELLRLVGGEHPPRRGHGLRVGTGRDGPEGCLGCSPSLVTIPSLPRVKMTSPPMSLRVSWSLQMES